MQANDFRYHFWARRASSPWPMSTVSRPGSPRFREAFPELFVRRRAPVPAFGPAKGEQGCELLLVQGQTAFGDGQQCFAVPIEVMTPIVGPIGALTGFVSEPPQGRNVDVVLNAVGGSSSLDQCVFSHDSSARGFPRGSLAFAGSFPVFPEDWINFGSRLFPRQLPAFKQKLEPFRFRYSFRYWNVLWRSISSVLLNGEPASATTFSSLAIGKAIFGLDRVEKSHDCDVRLRA